MEQYFLDGQFLKKDDIAISVDDRGYYFGDGVYEVIKVYNGHLFTAKEHFVRFFRSANEIKIAIPYTNEQLNEIALQLIELNQIKNGHVYIQITRGVSLRQHNFPESSVLPVVLAYAVETESPLSDREHGVTVKSVEDVRWLRCDIKSLNLLGSVLAKQEAREAGCTEAILHRGEIVTEGASTNMFGVKDGVVYTHPATNLILDGITRQVIIALCEENDIAFSEKAFTLQEALRMDEFFYTSTNVEVMPVIKIDEKVIGNGKPGPLTLKLQQAFTEKIPHKLTIN